MKLTLNPFIVFYSKIHISKRYISNFFIKWKGYSSNHVTTYSHFQILCLTSKLHTHGGSWTHDITLQFLQEEEVPLELKLYLSLFSFFASTQQLLCYKLEVWISFACASFHAMIINHTFIDVNIHFVIIPKSELRM